MGTPLAQLPVSLLDLFAFLEGLTLLDSLLFAKKAMIKCRQEREDYCQRQSDVSEVVSLVKKIILQTTYYVCIKL